MDQLPPGQARYVVFDYDADGRPDAGEIEKPVDADEVIITFTDTSGPRWRRAGNGEPSRVIGPGSVTE
ncbi:MAG: hypothetical protein ACRDRX_01915 [Pseudonocardiaceae bacterium]